ncbi:MAG: DUF3391 domain-containing protein [Comamonas sp.]|nr:DUF3391 domain-containing protein [Comamonas sp.]
MYVYLDTGWLRHPFPVNSFKITTAEQLQTLQSLSLQSIQYDPSRSDPEPGTGADIEAPADLGQEPVATAEACDEVGAWRACMQVLQSQFQSAVSDFDAVQGLVPTDLPAARQRSDALVAEYVVQLAQERDVILHLLADEGGGAACVHGVNSAVLSMLVGKTMGLQGQDLHGLGVAALLHDLGKQSLNIPVFAFALNQGQAGSALYMRHVGESVALAQAMGYGPAVTTAIAQHHEWADGSGFPLGLLASDMELAGQILALVNNYERLCNPPHAAAGQTPHEVLGALYGQYRQRYAVDVLQAFVQTLGVYPPGSLVELSDGRQGQVISVNTRQTLKPSVLVYSPDLETKLQLVDLAQQGVLGIRRGLHRDQVKQEAIKALQPHRRTCYFFDSSAAIAAEKGPL